MSETSDEFRIGLGAQIDTSNVQTQLNEATKKLTLNISNVTLADRALSDLQNALKKNDIALNLNLGNVQNIQKEAQNVGRNIGDLISKSAQRAIGNVSSPEIGRFFKVSSKDSAYFRSEMEKLVSSWTNGKGKISDIKIDTKTSYDKDTQESFERLHQAAVTYTNDLNEVIKKTIAWRQIGTTVDEKGNEQAVRGFVEVASQYSKSIEKINQQTDNFISKQKETVSKKTNELKKLYAAAIDPNASKPIKDSSNRENLTKKYIEAIHAIESMGNASKSTFAEEKVNVEDTIGVLNRLINKYKQAETMATTLRTKGIDVVKAQYGAKLDKVEANLQSKGFLGEKFDDKQLSTIEEKIKSIRQAIESSTEKSQFSNIIDDIDKLSARYDSLLSKNKALNEQDKLGIKSSSLASKIADLERISPEITNFTARINDADISVTSLKTDIENIGTKSDLDTVNAKFEAFKNAAKSAGIAVTETTSQLRGIDRVLGDIGRTNLSSTLQDWLTNNTAAAKETRLEVQRLFEEVRNNPDMTIGRGQEIRARLRELTSLERGRGGLGNSTWVALKQGMSKFTSWISASGAVMQAINEVRNGINTIKELDNALTNINYTMDVSSKQLKDIGNSAVQMAKDLHSSTSNVLQAVTLYANANETAESILEKSKTAIMLSNVSGLSGADSADLLQGVINQFDLGNTTDDLEHISDVIQNVSQNLAYDFSKGIVAINDAISTSGSVAHMAGLSLEEYAAMVGKTIEISRQDGGTVGNAYKTIFSRITKASVTEGTAEEDISKAEESLRAVNIEVRKSATEFRNVEDILNDLGEVWGKLDSVQQSNISFNLAGTRQTNILKSLLSNWEEYVGLVEKAGDANGTTLENQEKYAKSVKGYLGELKSTSESMWNNILNSGELKAGITLLTTLVKLLDKITGFAGSIGTVGLGLGAILGAKNAGGAKMSAPNNNLFKYGYCFKMPAIICVLWDTGVFILSDVKYTLVNK